MRKKLILFITISILVFSTMNAYATFTTGQGKHTFKVDIFRPTPQLRLNSFLVGFGINRKSSINFKLTSSNDETTTLNFIPPYYKEMGGTKEKNGSNFFLTGPVLDIYYQHIPANELFVTPSALNGIQLGIKTLQGNVYADKSESEGEPEKIENLSRAYLTAGYLNRSRFENNNLFSDFNFIYDVEHGGWALDTQVGMEFKLKGSFRAQLSYKYMATTADSANGASIGIRADY